jgi:alcohol dehydrogenase (cytochrome c)
MRSATWFLVAVLCAAPALLFGQQATGFDPAVLYKPLVDSWPTYAGDYTAKRYSALKAINRTTVKGLTLAWLSKMTPGQAPMPNGAPTVVGGVAKGDLGAGILVNIKGAILAVDDVLYVTSPDNVWKVDARDGRIIWHWYWRTRGGTHIGHRGAAIWRDTLFVETIDDYLVALETKTGKEKWHVEIADFEQQYFSTVAPVVVDNHVLVGTGNDLDAPGFLQSFNAETGKLEWKFYTVPMNPGDPGLETWPSLDAARHGGGQVWMSGSFDPETRLYMFGTGNPTPGYTGAPRPGDNLFTCSLIAVNVDTGKMAWYFQTSAHDTHDWDSTQQPVLFDATIDGKPRKLVSTATRNGYFYTLDRVTGQHIVTTKFGTHTNWSPGIRKTGVVNPGKQAIVPGTIVSPVEGGVTNWPSPAYSPDTGLFYTQERNDFNLIYLTEPDKRGAIGLGGKTVATLGSAGNFLTAINPKNGSIAWRKPFTGGGAIGGILATAGGLLFSSDGSGNIVAFDDRNGKPLWHSRIGNTSNAPQTYSVDGRQYMLVAVGDTLYAFSLY